MSDNSFVYNYLVFNSSKFNPRDLIEIRDRVSKLDASTQDQLLTINLKSPIICLILSLVFGGLGVDRYYLGDVLFGILKFLSIFIFIGVIWAIIDIFFCYEKAKEINAERVFDWLNWVEAKTVTQVNVPNS